MRQDVKRLFSMGVALVFVAVALLVYFDFIEPAYGNVQTLKGQIAATQTFLTTETKAVAQAQTLINSLNSESSSSQSVALAMPSGEDIAGIIAQVYGIAANNQVGVTSVSISPPLSQVSSDDSAVLKQLASVSIQISATGTYESLKAFLAQLETNVRLFDVQSLSVQPQTSLVAGKSVSSDSFTYGITVNTYFQLP